MKTNNFLSLFMHSFFAELFDSWSASLMKPQSCRTKVILQTGSGSLWWLGRIFWALEKQNRSSVLLRWMCITQVDWREGRNIHYGSRTQYVNRITFCRHTATHAMSWQLVVSFSLTPYIQYDLLAHNSGPWTAIM